MEGVTTYERNKNTRENANPLSVLIFGYTFPYFNKGWKKELEVEDLPKTYSKHASKTLGNKLEDAWNKEVERAKKANQTPSLFKALRRVFLVDFLLFGLAYIIGELVFRLIQPLAVGKLLTYYSAKEEEQITLTEAYLYATGVVLCSAINVFFMHPYMLACLHLGMKMRVACCSLIYRKALRLNKAALKQTTTGQLVNLLSNDVNRFDVSLLFAHVLWAGPIETLLITYLLYLQVGISAVFGVIFLLSFIPIQFYLGKRNSVLRLKTALRTDERVRLMNEIISGIQVIKMYTWEYPFAALVNLSRKFEIQAIRQTSYVRGLILSFIIFTTRISIFVSVLSYVLMGYGITAEQVFVLTSFYNILRQNMTIHFPQGITQVAEASVSLKRLNKFMLYEELPTNYINASRSIIIEDGKKPSMTNSKEKKGIFLKNVNAKWSTESTENTLEDITLNATSNTITVVIGTVGCGKSSLLQVILRELPILSGSLNVNGEVSYAAQEAWLFAGSVRQNILFGLPMNRQRYKEVIKKCALERDFQLFPYGDKTIVGERGVSLSGGQRARINLARAVYKKADIYLLDDPLSAVDAHVGKHLYEECIRGYLKDKTVILITHQLQFLQDADNIILLNNGKIQAEGNYYALQEKNLDFTSLLVQHAVEDKVDELSETGSLISRHSSIYSFKSVTDIPKAVQETRTFGTIGSYVYKTYLRAGGNICFLQIVLWLFILCQLFASAGDYFLGYWVNLEETVFNNESYYEALNATNKIETYNVLNFKMTTNACIYIYTIISILTVVITLVRSMSFFYMCMKASINLHNTMFQSITRATMYFFNTNPSGRILNRFSKDIGAIDELLPAALIDVLQIFLQLFGIIVVIAIVNSFLMIPTAVIGIIFIFLRKYYIRTGRSVKRLEGITRSPVFSHLNASLQGLTTIRAFRAEGILVKEFDDHQDLHSSAWFLFLSTSRAFGFYIDLICCVFIALVTYSFLVFSKDSLGGDVGLAITQAIGLTGMMQWGIRQTTEVENQMTSVERVLEYSDLEKERELQTSDNKKPPPDWPKDGAIQFRNVFLRYSPNEPFVLKNLNFKINSMEKVGIVGRTGAGKSSLISALFQLTETTGDIIIDNIEIEGLGLHDLRSKIAIIPQEPVLFSGTMRKNLDPFDEFTDDVLWRALEEVELKEVVMDLTSGLNSQISEGGTNFSVGQRQLVCLARAIVRNNKILVLDEATANVDPQTDGLIQTTIRNKFNKCTVLTIAHRLHTIMDSDKVLVMDAGTMVEFDHPYILLQNPTGYFSSMLEQTGPNTSQLLTQIAENHYKKTKE